MGDRLSEGDLRREVYLARLNAEFAKVSADLECKNEYIATSLKPGTETFHEHRQQAAEMRGQLSGMNKARRLAEQVL